MPELPEVEVVRRGLAERVSGRRIATVQVLHPRAVRRHPLGAKDFESRLVGRRVVTVSRRGKYLWLSIGEGEALTAHLGMSGQLLVQPTDAGKGAHLRVMITFADQKSDLHFVDQRTFGGMALEVLVPDDRGGHLPQSVAHIARDPLDPLFDDELFAARLRARKTGLKRALLDQTLLSGVGNIYADEALWRARLHGARRTESVRPQEAAQLLSAARKVMVAALAEGGTSFDALYVDVDGASGYFERELQAYGRADEPCARCGALIVRKPFMNRSSYFCPVCQARPRRPRW